MSIDTNQKALDTESFQNAKKDLLSIMNNLNENDALKFREFIREQLNFGKIIFYSLIFNLFFQDGDLDKNVEEAQEMIDKVNLNAYEETEKNEEKLEQIILSLRKALPISAMAPDEVLKIPNKPAYANFTEKNTIHVDEFLYSDDEVDRLAAKGKISRNYCIDCGSKNVKPLSMFTILRMID